MKILTRRDGLAGHTSAFRSAFANFGVATQWTARRIGLKVNSARGSSRQTEAAEDDRPPPFAVCT